MKQKTNKNLLEEKGISTINQLRKYIHDCFKGLHFNEEAHAYTHSNQTLVSTSKFISAYSKPFDARQMSILKSKSSTKGMLGDRRTPEYYRKRWEYLRDESTNKGSRVHMYAECYPKFDPPACNKEQAILDFFKWVEDNEYSVIMLELRMHDLECGKAGTTDGLLFDKKNKEILMFDFKTNEADLFKYYGKLLKPFNSLVDSKYNKYTLQAGDYTYMFEKATGLIVNKKMIVWINDKDFSSAEYKRQAVKPSVDKSFKIYELEDLSDKLRSESIRRSEELKSGSKRVLDTSKLSKPKSLTKSLTKPKKRK